MYDTLIFLCFILSYPSLHILWFVNIGTNIVATSSRQPPWMDTLTSSLSTFTEYTWLYFNFQGQSWYPCLVGYSLAWSSAVWPSSPPHRLMVWGTDGQFSLNYDVPWAHPRLHSFARIRGEYEYILLLHVCEYVWLLCWQYQLGTVIGLDKSVWFSMPVLCLQATLWCGCNFAFVVCKCSLLVLKFYDEIFLRREVVKPGLLD